MRREPTETLKILNERIIFKSCLNQGKRERGEWANRVLEETAASCQEFQAVCPEHRPTFQSV